LIAGAVPAIFDGTQGSAKKSLKIEGIQLLLFEYIVGNIIKPPINLVRHVTGYFIEALSIRCLFSFAFAYIIAISVPMCQAVSDFKLP
jgi:hypothetical protein